MTKTFDIIIYNKSKSMLNIQPKNWKWIELTNENLSKSYSKKHVK